MPAEFRVRAVLFDLDGTLVDSTPAVDRAWAAWEERWDVRLGVRASALGRPARDIVAAHVPADRVDEAFGEIERLEVADVEGVVPMRGAAELLAALPPEAWAIATSCSAPLAAARLLAAGIDARVVVTSSDTARGKPDPAPYLEAARRLGVPPSDCLVVEDAVAGVVSGRAAGCGVLAVLGSAPAAELGADAVVASLQDVRVVREGTLLRVTATAV